jgi:hypothetical protein
MAELPLTQCHTIQLNPGMRIKLSVRAHHANFQTRIQALSPQPCPHHKRLPQACRGYGAPCTGDGGQTRQVLRLGHLERLGRSYLSPTAEGVTDSGGPSKPEQPNQQACHGQEEHKREQPSLLSA